ncbi:MAG: hypothetical protein QW563_05820 [Candidatus Methanomethylicia archaeon]
MVIINIKLFSIFLLVGIIITLSITYYIMMDGRLLNKHMETRTSIPHGPVPFDRVAEEVDLDVVVKQWGKRGLTLYLPTYLPKGLKLTAIYGKVLNGEVGNIIIVVYSNTGTKKIYSAELTIQVVPLPGIPWYVTNSSKEKMMKINDLDVYLNTKAPYWDPYGEYSKKYGDYCIVADMQIGVLNYQYCFAPIFSEDEIVSILKSIKPVASLP